MTNHDRFRKASSGELVCPSDCIGPELCQKIEYLDLLKKSSDELNRLTQPETADAVYAYHGDHRPIGVADDTQIKMRAILAGSCLRFYLIEMGELTESD